MERTNRSRRQFLRQCAGMVISSAACKLAAQQKPKIRFSLAREFRNAYLLATSPSGNRFCLGFTDQPETTFRLSGMSNKPQMPSGATGQKVSIMETASGKPSATCYFRQRPYRGSFFSDDRRLYVQTLAFDATGHTVSQHALVNAATGAVDQQLRAEHPELATAFFSALSGRTLLGTEVDGTTRRTSSLVRVALPDYAELQRSAFAPGPNDRFSTELAFSADRTTVAYAVGNSILCRRTSDLGIVWKQEVEPSRKIWRLASTPDGHRIAAAIIDTTFIDHQVDCSVRIYDGRAGAELVKLPLNGFRGIGISPDGTLLALGEQTSAGSTVQIYNLSSGELLTSLDAGLPENFNMNGIQFLADGRHLITSGVHTRLWQISRPS